MKKIMNWLIAPLTLAIVNPVAVNYSSQTYNSVTLDVSDSALTEDIIFVTNDIVINKTFNTFSNYYPIELPSNIDPANFTEVSRTDDAVVRISLTELWGDENVIYSDIISFNPFNLINFENIPTLLFNGEEVIFFPEHIKNDMIGKANTISFDNHMDLKISFNVYVAGFWFRLLNTNKFYLVLPMLAQSSVDYRPGSVPQFKYNLKISLKLGSVIRFS